jgi:hypothetical protein
MALKRDPPLPFTTAQAAAGPAGVRAKPAMPVAPPPTRFAPVPLQRQAVGAKPVASVPPPPTRFGAPALQPRAAGPGSAPAVAPPPTRFASMQIQRQTSLGQSVLVVAAPPTKFGPRPVQRHAADAPSGAPAAPLPTSFSRMIGTTSRLADEERVAGTTRRISVQSPLHRTPAGLGGTSIQRMESNKRKIENEEVKESIQNTENTTSSSDEGKEKKKKKRKKEKINIDIFLQSIGDKEFKIAKTDKTLSCWNFALHNLSWSKEKISPDNTFAEGVNLNKNIRMFKEITAEKKIKVKLEKIVVGCGFIISETKTNFQVCAYVKRPEFSVKYHVGLDHWWIKAYGVTIETWAGLEKIQIWRGDQREKGHEYIMFEIDVIDLTKEMRESLQYCLDNGKIKQGKANHN